MQSLFITYTSFAACSFCTCIAGCTSGWSAGSQTTSRAKKKKKRWKKLYDRLLLSPDCMREYTFVHFWYEPNSQIRPCPILLFLFFLFFEMRFALSTIHLWPGRKIYDMNLKMCFNYFCIFFQNAKILANHFIMHNCCSLSGNCNCFESIVGWNFEMDLNAVGCAFWECVSFIIINHHTSTS